MPSNDAPTDRELVSAFLETRSEASFRRLYRRHVPYMVRIARRLQSAANLPVEDVVQEAWLRAVPALERFEWRSSLRSWLAGFVVNVIRESRRSSRGRPGPRPAEEAMHRDPLLEIEIRDALEQMPPGYRSVIALHDMAGFTHVEIGEILGIDPGTSKSQLARARQRLRALIGEKRSENR